MLRIKKRDIVALTGLQICKTPKKEKRKTENALTGTGAAASSSYCQCQNERVLFLRVSAGLCHPGESPSPVQ